ncbi:MAG: hypothetical protein KDJ52_16770 [Anaerolineae bacterium]|nr:hypothetical protein [Anaerolineae bacterium]
MARLPNPGSDEGVWGIVLNEFLKESHHADGKLKGVIEVFNVKDFGAKGDGQTDDTQAIQEAINAVNESGRKSGLLFFPYGAYKANNLKIPTSIHGLTIFGSGRYDLSTTEGTWIINTGSNPLFTTEGDGSLINFTIHDLSFKQADSSGGHIFEPVNGPAFMKFEQVYFYLTNPNASFIKSVVGNPAHITLQNIRGYMASGAQVPAVDISSEYSDNLFGIEVVDTMINSNVTATAPIFRLENRRGGGLAYGPIFRNVTLEAPGGGGIHLYSFTRTILEGVVAADLPTDPGPSQPIILIAKSLVDGSSTARDIVIMGCSILLGTPQNPDLKIESEVGQNGVVIISSRINQLESTLNPPIIIASRIAKLVGETTPLWLDAGGRVRGVRSISQTTTEAYNLRGSFTISGGSKVATVDFNSKEKDIDYFLTVTPTTTVGSPTFGSNRIFSISKSAESFIVQVEVAPGTGNSVTFDWHLIR